MIYPNTNDLLAAAKQQTDYLRPETRDRMATSTEAQIERHENILAYLLMWVWPQ